VLPEEGVLELDRVRLRALGEEHAAGLLVLYGDPEVTRYLARPALREIDEARAMVERAKAGFADGTSLQLAIERRKDGAFLGSCLLFHIHKASARAELGYSLGREHWSHGYMAESLQGLVGHAFGPMALNRLEADIDPRNAASARQLARLGFRREGLLRERWIVRGEASDSEMYGLLAREWRGSA